MEDLVLTIPAQDAAFIETLAQRMGWTMRKRRTSVERFIVTEGRFFCYTTVIEGVNYISEVTSSDTRTDDNDDR